MADESRKFDVAISFLHEDLGLATTLRDGLGSTLDVFIYTEKQKELAGTDGLASFREAFRHQSRLVVVLHRQRWGETDWTRVEKQAIEERFLKEGPPFLFVIMLDEDPPPPWLPQYLIRFSLKDFGVEQAIGAIKVRALELGSVVQPPSTAFLAKRAREISEFGKRRGELLDSRQGVLAVETEVGRLLSLVSDKLDEIEKSEPKLGVRYGVDQNWFVIKRDSVAVHASYRNRIVNTLSNARFVVRELRGGVIMPGEQGRYMEDPRELAETVFLPELDRGYGWCWKLEGGEVKTSEQLADFCVGRLFALIEAEAAGELPNLWE
jgi:hypothetical protein